jgi:short subunit dehydrogenase-like uncharacterized protein
MPLCVPVCLWVSAGEVGWVREIADRFHKQAEDQGVFLVPACGFDSVPSDLTCWLAESNIREMCARTHRDTDRESVCVCMCERESE